MSGSESESASSSQAAQAVAAQQGASGGLVSSTGARVGELGGAALLLLAAGLSFNRLGRRHYRAAHRA